MVNKNVTKVTLLIALIFFFGMILISSITNAQNWVELPPYNTLWPLWSPALSPVNDVTGLPTPIISSLTPDTLLPVMPGLTWDPSVPYPWLLYNTGVGMAYFDPLAGINLWPNSSLIDGAGLPIPISLPLGYENLPITDAFWLANNIPLANNSFLLSYQSFQQPVIPWFPAIYPPPLPTPSFTSLLTPLDILGPTIGVPSILTPPEPPTIPTQIFSALIVPASVAPPTAAISGLFYF